MKYIIEIEDEPFVRKSCLHGEEAVYRAKGFKSLVFDQTGLEKLTPADEVKWIPVSKKLPEDVRNCYWVCTDTGYQCQCRWTNTIWMEETTNWRWHIMDIPQYTRVIAWRELPEPYKEEGDEE